MVPTPCGSLITASTGFVRLTKKVSGPSKTASSVIATVTNASDWPAAKVRTPDVPVKSTPSVAVSPAVSKVTDEANKVLPVLVTVKTATPASSFTETSLMAKLGRSRSSVIVPTPCGSAMVALTALERSRVKLSSPS